MHSIACAIARLISYFVISISSVLSAISFFLQHARFSPSRIEVVFNAKCVRAFQGLREQQHPGQSAVTHGTIRHEFGDSGGGTHGGLPRGET